MLSDLLLSVTDAVLSYAIDKLDPAETIKSWLKREPAQLAFQKALARTYSAFARQYPDYTASLFDQTFLTTKAVPELSKLLIRNQHPDPALLAQAWGESLGADAEFSTRATKPASDFLLWLEAELKGEQALQPLFDSRALDNIEAGIEKLTQELQHKREAAFKSADAYQIQIGGNVTNSNIIIGDNNTVNQYFYSGDFVSLNEYYIPPDGVFQRVRVDEFIGRDWLTAKVDAFLNDPNRKSGAFLLIGDAGVGKTSFMAHLVQERRYLHLFGEQIPGDVNLPRALQSLGSQLVSRYQIDPYRDRDALTRMADFPDFLERLLRLAVGKLAIGEKIVIVCDALDEAGIFPDGNVLGLPNVLPDGVYLILSQRPINVKLPNLSPHIERLDAQSNNNLKDMEIYLGTAVKYPSIARQLSEHKYSETFFIETLKEKSLGIWMYLHFILREIEKGSRAPLDLENLPTGLFGYYVDFWDDWRNSHRDRSTGPHKWDELYAPLLTTLAAAQEPISIEQLMSWANVQATSREVERLLSEAWRAFVDEKQTPTGRLFAPYHSSFRDFLTGKIQIDHLSPIQSNMAKDLAERTCEAHQRIISTFETTCKGQLETLVEQNYPRLYLCTHLAGAKQFAKLVRLLTEGTTKIQWAELRKEKEETYAGYLHDLTYVWEHAEQEKNFVLLIRCMLIKNSIYSLAANVPPRLIVELAKSGLWNIAHSLTIVRQKPTDSERAESLELLARLIPASQIPEILTIVRNLQDENVRAHALSILAPFLSDEIKYQQLASLSDIDDENARSRAISALACQASDDLKLQALEMARDLKNNVARFYTLLAFAHFLPDTLKSQALNEAIATAHNISDQGTRCIALSKIASQLPDESKVRVFTDALAIAIDVNDENSRANLFLNIIPNLPAELIDQAFAAVNNTLNGSARAHALLALTPRIKKELGKEVIAEELERIRYIQDETDRSNALINLVPYLPDQTKAKAFNIAFRILNEVPRARALAVLAPVMPVKLQARAFRSALNAARRVVIESLRAQILSDLAPYLPNEYKAQALSIVLQIQSEVNQSLALSSIFPYLSQTGKAQALKAVLKIQKVDIRTRTLSKVISVLPEELRMQALKAALTIVSDIQDEFACTRALISLVPHLQKELSDQVIETATQSLNKIQDGNERALALSELALCFPSELMPRALTFACEIGKEDVRAFALSKIAPCLPDNLMSDVLNAINNMHKEFHRARTLAAFVPYLPERILPEALTVAREIKQPYPRVRALSALIPVLPTELSFQVFKEANTIASEIDDEYQNVTAISALAPYLQEKLKSLVLKVTLNIVPTIRNERARARALLSLVPHLPNILHLSAFEIATDFQQEEFRGLALSSLVPYVSIEIKLQILSKACEIRNEYHRVYTLIAILQYIPANIKPQVLSEAFTIANNSLREPAQSRVLGILAPYFDADTQKKIYQEAMFNTDQLRELVTSWKELNYDGLEDKMIPFLRLTAQKNRIEGFRAIRVMGDPLTTFAGKDIVPEIYRAITDVTRWWP